MSSPNITTKGSSPIKLLACNTASPNPFGYGWRTKNILIPVVSRTISNNSCLPFISRLDSNSMLESKWSSIARLLFPVTIKISSIPEANASSTIN